MSAWITESGLTWRTLAPFGAEIAIDLSSPLNTAPAQFFARLLWQHGFVLVRGQRLSMARQQEVCALVGPILIRPGENGYLSTENASEPSLSELSWHADAAYTNAPFDAIALHAIDVVDDASSTLFASAEQGLAALPAVLCDTLMRAQTEMISPSYDAIALRSCDRRDPVAQKRGLQPAVYINPHNGRSCVWVNELQTARLLGMGWEDSRDTLHAVYDHIYAPALVHEHRWRQGDFLIWDNIALQHKRGPLHGVGKRVLQRVIVGTEGVAPHMPLGEKAQAL
jgi:taurine dioxygenase